MKRIFTLALLLALLSNASNAATGTWTSTVAGKISYKSTAATKAKKDYNGKLFTVVYLENLGFDKIGGNTNAEDVQWLRDNGFAVIELDYGKNPQAISPYINQDIIAINSELSKGTFCGINNISQKRAFILFEGYRIQTDVSYYLDDPTVYNYPDYYKATAGDSLFMDIIYPANASKQVPALLSFSYSNSWGHKSSASARGENAHLRMYLPYTLACGTFYDSILEGAPARGIAWAIADHPKYCEWGQGKRTGGANKEYASIAANPDAACKVKSAVRTLRAVGKSLGLSDEIGIYGFSRGSTTGALAVGDRRIEDFETNARGRFADVDSKVQAAILGPGVFDYTLLADGFTDKNEYKNAVKVWGDLASNQGKWQLQGANYLVETANSAPCLFFYNSDDEGFYGKCAEAMREKLNALGVETELIKDYRNGHCVPNDDANLTKIYDFLVRQFTNTTGITTINRMRKCGKEVIYDINGRRMPQNSVLPKGIYISDNKKYQVK